MKKAGLSLIIAVVFSCVTASLFADVVIFTTGERKSGIVTELPNDPDNVTFLSTAGEMKIPKSRIAKITAEPRDVGYYHIARGFFDMKNLSGALENVEEAIRINAENKEALELRDMIHQERKDDAQRRLREKSLQIDQSLQEVAKLIEDKKFLSAETQLDAAARADINEEQKARVRSLAIKLYHLWGEDSLDRLDSKGAAEKFEKVLQIDPEHKDAMARILILWERDPAMNARLVAIYQKRFEQNPDDIESARKLADLLIRDKNTAAAIPYLIMIRQASATPDVINEERLFDALSQRYSEAARENNFAAAITAFEEFLKYFPDEDPAPLFFYQYSEKIKNLADDDLDGRVEIALFCKTVKLDDEAKKEILYVLEKNPKHEQAIKLLADYAQSDISEAELAFSRKEYDTVVHIANRITSEYNRLPDIVARATELSERADNEIRREQREKGARALALSRRGDEYSATAESHINAMKSLDRRSDLRIVSDKEEARKFLRRAIDAWEAALRIDPSLARADSEDLNTKLRDAKSRLMNLNRVPVIPDSWSARRGRANR